MAIHILLLSLIIICAAFAVVRTRVIRAAIMLATISILVTIVLFVLNTPLAAIFEISVCAGLITVIFISVISLTNPLTTEERCEERDTMFKKFLLLPVIIAVCAAAFYMLTKGINFIPLASEASVTEISDRAEIWHLKQIDLIGQIIIILTGVFGVVVLFKDNKDDKNEL
jgi:NADH-quinone oxidoreductase subunit J